MPFTPLGEQVNSFKPLGQQKITSPSSKFTGNIFADTPEAALARKDTAFIGGNNNFIKNDISNAFTGGISQVKEGYNQAKNSTNILQLLGGGLKEGAGVFNAALSPLTPVFHPVGQAIDYAADKISDIPAVQKFANSPTGINTAKVVGDVNNLNTIVGGVAGAMDLAPKVSNLVSDTVNKVKNPPVPPLDEAKITDLYNRAIKPTVAGKNNASQITKANDTAVTGLKVIADNKPNLAFTDANGERVSGTTPKTVDQLSQAIQQTKSSIFKQYDALSKQAGEQGVKVDTASIGSELTPVIESKSLAIANPKAIEYAKALRDRLTQTGDIDAQTAQDVIQHYNDSLKAFYRNPSYDTASNVQIDALVANKFREALDNGVSGATGEQYQALKSKYGALSSMEKDVAHRNIVWGRQNAVGLGANISNIASGAELVRGLITLNPLDLVSSATMKGIQLYAKYLNNPDVGVSRIFSAIDKANPPSIGSKSGQVIPNIK